MGGYFSSYLSSYWSCDHVGIIARSNRDLEKEFSLLHIAQRKFRASIENGESADHQRECEAAVNAILKRSALHHYTENCRFLPPGLEVQTGNTAIHEVLKEYTDPEGRGHSRVKFVTEEIGPMGTGGDYYYERGVTVFDGSKYCQKNNHLLIRKKVMVEVDGKQVPTFPIDTAIYNEIEIQRK